MSSTHADFTGIPFIAGSINGERSFNVEPTGRLKSPMKPFTWEPHENIATCLKADTSIARRLRRSWPQAYEVAKQWVPEGVRISSLTVVSTERYSSILSSHGAIDIQINWYSPETGDRGTERVSRAALEQAVWETYGHDFGTCSCGFYAYLNGRNEYDNGWNVTGVIEGYGDTFIGDRGFRTSKARIIALSFNPGYWGSEVERRFLVRYGNLPLFTSRREMLREFPATDVEEVLSLRDEEGE